MKQKHVKVRADPLTHRVYARRVLFVILLIYIELHFFVVEVQTLNVICAETIQKTTHYE